MKALTLSQDKSQLRDVLLVTMASILLAFSGKISFTLPFTPVPIAIQNNAILLVGLLLGARRGFYAVALLLFQALIGLPVLSAGATVGLARFLGPTGGYLIGYAISAYVAGRIYEKKGALFALTAGLLTQYTIGGLWLGNFVGFANAITCGVVPFILGDTLLNLGLSCLQFKKHRS